MEPLGDLSGVGADEVEADHLVLLLLQADELGQTPAGREGGREGRQGTKERMHMNET
jgi:hypothetical protein